VITADSRLAEVAVICQVFYLADIPLTESGNPLATNTCRRSLWFWTCILQKKSKEVLCFFHGLDSWSISSNVV
jgi:hypothetical protein